MAPVDASRRATHDKAMPDPASSTFAPSERLTYKVPEVARLLGIQPNLVYKLIASGALRSVRAGRLVLIPKEAVTEFLARPDD